MKDPEGAHSDRLYEKKWRKVLYLNQNVSDNYVDESFLREMKKNIYVRSYNFWDVVYQTTILIQQICTVICMVLVWWLMNEGILSPALLLKALAVLFISGFGLYFLVASSMNSTHETVWNTVSTSLVVLGLTDFLSPILQTLTYTISTDTIYTMSAFMILGHLLLHDYRVNASLISRTVSLNMSLFSSVCLASRLKSPDHVFSLVILALILFGLWPSLQRQLMKNVPCFQVPFTIFLATATFLTLYFIEIAISLSFVLFILFISFLCPLILISLQPHKNNIHGPWDEAVINPPDSPKVQKKTD